jgi:hypothetical protein
MVHREWVGAKKRLRGWIEECGSKEWQSWSKSCIDPEVFRAAGNNPVAGKKNKICKRNLSQCLLLLMEVAGWTELNGSSGFETFWACCFLPFVQISSRQLDSRILRTTPLLHLSNTIFLCLGNFPTRTPRRWFYWRLWLRMMDTSFTINPYLDTIWLLFHSHRFSHLSISSVQNKPICMCLQLALPIQN